VRSDWSQPRQTAVVCCEAIQFAMTATSQVADSINTARRDNNSTVSLRPWTGVNRCVGRPNKTEGLFKCIVFRTCGHTRSISKFFELSPIQQFTPPMPTKLTRQRFRVSGGGVNLALGLAKAQIPRDQFLARIGRTTRRQPREDPRAENGPVELKLYDTLAAPAACIAVACSRVLYTHLI